MRFRSLPVGLLLASTAGLVACSEPPVPEGDATPMMDATVEDRSTSMPDGAPVDTGVVMRCTMATECDDGIACTEDACGMDGVCTHTAMNDRCSDGRFCNGAESCSTSSGCTGGTAPTCDDMNANTTDRCDEAANACRNDPLDNDGDGDPAMSAGGHDCDDNDRTRSSLEREVCNGRDDNCNGMTDDGALNSCGNCDPNCRGVSTGGMGGTPFDMGGQRGVELDPMAGGLLVRAQSRTGDYLWIPNTNESTLSKWDANTGMELARYRVGLAAGACPNNCCHVAGCNMPSRTVVDGYGDAYVANRGFSMQGTITKVAADRRDCVDRNGNGMIDTSTGPADVRAYGQDECVLWTSNVGGAGATLRALTIDRGDTSAPQGYPWVGACPDPGTAGSQPVWKLDPQTGAVLRTLTTPAAWTCSYGGVGLADGSVWFHRYGGYGGGILRLDTATNTFTGPFFNNVGTSCRSTYGITADANGRIWLSGIGCNTIIGYDPRANQWTEASIGTTTGLGITIDPMNNVWTQVYPSGNTLIRFPASAFVGGGTVPAAMITRIPTSRSFGQVTAIGADRGGNIWFTNTDVPTTVVRYEPAMSRFTNFSGANRVYTYTDFTGSVRRTVIGTGTYTQDYDTQCDNPTIANLSWDATTPMGTSLAFSVRSAATAAALGGAMNVAVASAPTDASPVDVAPRLSAAMVTARRFVRVTVTFNTSTMPIASPVLRGMSLAWRCPYTVPSGG